MGLEHSQVTLCVTGFENPIRIRTPRPVTQRVTYTNLSRRRNHHSAANNTTHSPNSAAWFQTLSGEQG